MNTDPCDRNCKDRISKIEDDGKIINCHSTCERYAEFRKIKDAEYIQRAFEMQKENMTNESMYRMKRIRK